MAPQELRYYTDRERIAQIAKRKRKRKRKRIFFGPQIKQIKRIWLRKNFAITRIVKGLHRLLNEKEDEDENENENEDGDENGEIREIKKHIREH